MNLLGSCPRRSSQSPTTDTGIVIIHKGEEQTIEVVLNNHPVETVRLQPGAASYRVLLPERLLVRGDNRLAFRYGYHRSPAQTRDSRDRRQLAVAWGYVDKAAGAAADDELRARIDARVEHMFAGGLVREVMNLTSSGYRRDDPVSVRYSRLPEHHFARPVQQHKRGHAAHAIAPC